MIKNLFGLVFFSSFFAFVPNFVSAQEMTEDGLEQSGTESVLGSACERINNQETKASIRLRATDKATFEAVQALDEIADWKKKYNEHDLNVLIYKVVDNYVEDLSAQTTQQNDEKICVEVSAYVKKDNLLLAESEFLAEKQNSDMSADFSENNLDAEPEVSSSEVESENTPAAKDDNTVVQEQNLLSKSADEESDEDVQSSDLAKNVYVAPLEFFNGTSSEGYAGILKKTFEKGKDIRLIDAPDNADYIVTAKILRAKVDPINSQTNRMQMVLSVMAKSPTSDAEFSEHQNRFILFSASDDEQKVAADLMQKLLNKAGKIILKKIEKDAQISSAKDAPFITPEHSSPVQVPNASQPETTAN